MRHAVQMICLLAAAALAGCAERPLDQPMSGFGQAARAAAAEQGDPTHADGAPISSSGAHAAAVILKYMQRPRQAGEPNGMAPTTGPGGGPPPPAPGPASAASGT